MEDIRTRSYTVCMRFAVAVAVAVAGLSFVICYIWSCPVFSYIARGCPAACAASIKHISRMHW